MYDYHGTVTTVIALIQPSVSVSISALVVLNNLVSLILCTESNVVKQRSKIINIDVATHNMLS